MFCSTKDHDAKNMMRELSQPEQSIVADARFFGESVIGPNAETWEKQGRVPAIVFEQAGEMGLCRLLVPSALGGLELSVTAMATVMEILSSHCFASAFSFVVHNNLAANIARNAKPDLQRRTLPALMDGTSAGAFLLTEPKGGSDAAGIETSAVKIESGWLLNGEKAWVSNGTHASTLSVYAQTDPSAGSRGIGCFLVDADSPGVVRGPAYELLGGHALGTCGFTFEDCEVSHDAVLVEPGQGFRAAMQGIDLARVNVAAMCCGMMDNALSVALAAAHERQAFGQAIIDFQGIQWMLADVATNLAAARALAYRAAALVDTGKIATLESAHAKKFATRAALSGIAECMQAMGAPGLSRTHSLARHLAAAKMAQFMDGTTEIQNVVISRGLMKSTTSANK